MSLFSGRTRLVFFFLLLLSVGTKAAPDASLLKNINTTRASHEAFYMYDAVTVGSTTYFTANDSRYGNELWKTDGTTAGTVLVKDVFPGPAHSNCSQLIVSGTFVYFTADDGEHGMELWRTNGTPAGTHMVADLNWGVDGSSPAQLRVFQGGVSFIANVSLDGLSLCASKGTSETTRVIKALPPSDQADPSTMPMAQMGGNLYFGYPDPTRGWELWKSNGTAAGTTVLKDIYPGSEGSYANSFVVAGTTLYFSAQDSTHGFEPWKSNGTAAGTVMIKDLCTGEGGSNPGPMTAVGNQAFFGAADDGVNFRLWRSDGTKAGTWVVVDYLPEAMVSFQNKLHFVPSAGSAGLMRADSTPGAVTEIFWAPATATGTSMVTTANRIFLAFHSPTTGAELWSSDGTSEGSLSPKPLAGSASGFWGGLFAADNKAYFAGNDLDNGPRLWRSDGTVDGTYPFGPPANQDAGSSPAQFRASNGIVYFTAHEGANRALWRSDGTAAGTTKVKTTGPNYPGPFYFLGELDDLLLFTADDGQSGAELWKTDGTEAGTVRVANIAPGLTSGEPRGGVQLGSHFYFSAVGNNTQGRELWRTDGTEVGTVLFADLAPVGGSDPKEFTLMGGALYFATSISSGGRLYRTDGTTPTVIEGVSNPANLTAFAGALYFTVSSGGNLQLWRSEGTTGTTSLVKSIIPAVGSAKLDNFRILGNRLFFLATTNSISQLWESDGTAGGTKVSPITTASPRELSVAGGYLYFNIVYPQTGLSALWASDGTTPAVLLQTGLSSLGKAFQNTQFFVKYQGDTQGQIWKTQGTPATTEPIPHAYMDRYSSFNDFDVAGDHLLVFGGYTAATGKEPSVIDLGAALSFERLSTSGLVTGPLSTGAAVDFGKQAVAASVTRTLRLRNAGSLTLGGLAALVEGGGAAHFTITAPPPATLAAGAWFDLQVNFTPQATGAQTASLIIDSNDAEAGAVILALTGTGIALGKPVLLEDLPPQLVLAGLPLSMRTTFAAAAPVAYTWRRATTIVSTTEVLSLASPKSKDAGLYTVEAKNAQGYVNSNAAPLAIVDPAPATVTAVAGTTVTLKCKATAPAGATLSYQWLRNGIALSSTLRIKGTTSATLTISPFTGAEAGEFDCIVTLQTPAGPLTLNHGKTLLSRTYTPVFADISLPDAHVGQSIQLTLAAANGPTRFAATGLPPGITFNTATGTLSGRPTAAKIVAGVVTPYLLKFTASNAAGTSPVRSVYWTISPLALAGSHSALVQRDSSLNADLGGTLQLTVTTTGSASGVLTLGAARHTFSGLVQTDETGNIATFTHTLPRSGRTPLQFALTLTADTATLSGSVGDAASGPISVDGFTNRATRALGQPLAGYYTVALQTSPAVSSNADYPQGDGFLTFTLSASAVANWIGKLSDGTTLTGSSALSISSHLRFHQVLYTSTGSVQGWVQISPDVDGAFEWFKKPQLPASTTRSYKAGFTLHDLIVGGGRYEKPFAGQPVLGLAEAPPDNAKLVFTDAGLTTDIVESLAISSANVVKVPANAHGLKVTSLNATTGLFAGSFTLTTPDNVQRTAPFSGVIVTRLAAGTGYFILAKLPTTPGATGNTTPTLSGQVTLGAAP